MMRLWEIACAALLLSQVSAQAAAPPADLVLRVSVADTSNQPVSNARIELKTGQAAVASAVTDQSGQVRFTTLKPGRYEISAIKDGFETARTSEVDLSQSAPAWIELTLTPLLARHDSVDVKDTATPLDQGGSAPSDLHVHTVTELPGRPATPKVPRIIPDSE